MMGDLVTSPRESAETLLLLKEKFGLSCFCMTPEFDCKKDSVAAFIARRDRAIADVCAQIPHDVKIIPSASVLLLPGLSEECGLKRLLLPKTNELPIKLPYFSMINDAAVELNRLLYHTSWRICLLSFDSYVNCYSRDEIARLSNLENVSFQFNYRSLESAEIRALLKQLLSRNATVRFGSELHSYGKACYYELDHFIELAKAHFSEYERDLMFFPKKKF